MEDEPSETVNFVPCVKWVKRGVAKSSPDKVELSQKELADIIKDTKNKIRLNDNEGDDSGDSGTEEPSVPGDDEFDLQNYENEDESYLPGISDVADYTKSEHETGEDEDSEAEDDIIKPSDNLVLVGHVEGDSSILEVYVYNEEEGSLYVHHDMLLSSFPLALEWLNYDPEDINTPGNLCAVASMQPIIEVWDLDLINAIEPAFKLGKKGSRKKGIPRIGHSDAVLDLNWNHNLNHILASASVDRTVLVWDLETKQPGTTLTAFEEKVQSIRWHPFEGQTLLSGSCDRTVKVFDCRTVDSYKSWAVDGEVEKVAWNHFSPYNFFVATSLGHVHYFDCRNNNNTWKLTAAHQKEVTGLSLSTQCPGVLVTAGQDGVMKTWDILEAEPVFVSEKNLNIGNVHCLDLAPDSPFVVCAGGEKKSNNFGVWHLLEQSANEERFSRRELVLPVVHSDNVEMESVPSSSSVQPSTSNGGSTMRVPLAKKKSLEKKHNRGYSVPFKKMKRFKHT